jgi:excisionase family DNA binding protein
MRGQTEVEREAYSVNDLVRARIFGGRSKVYEKIKAGILTSYRDGKLRRITAESVRRHQAEPLEATRKDIGLAPIPNLKHHKTKQAASRVADKCPEQVVDQGGRGGTEGGPGHVRGASSL